MLLRACEPNFAAPLYPATIVHDYSLTDDERKKAKIAAVSGHELAIWKDDEGLFICCWQGTTVKAKTRDLVIEHFMGDPNIVLRFSDGTYYP